MKARSLLLVLRWSFCIFLMWASGQAVLVAWNGRGEAHLGGHGQLLMAGVEFCAALALLVPTFGKPAAAALCVVCAVAGIVSLWAGEAPVRFVYYAATAAFLGFSQRAPKPLAP